MVPGFRVVAVSMEGLEIGIAGVSSIPIEMVNLKLGSMVEEPSTVGAATALVFDQGGQSLCALRCALGPAVCHVHGLDQCDLRGEQVEPP